MAEGGNFGDFMASQRARLVARTDLQRFKAAGGSDSFHSYDPREKVRPEAAHAAGCAVRWPRRAGGRATTPASAARPARCRISRVSRLRW
jgi:hypothetical protein